MPARVSVIHGPNLNLLGTREPDIYGSQTLAQIDARIVEAAAKRGAHVVCTQANGEGALIDLIHGARDGIVINPAGYSHTSVAIADALRSVAVPAVEVHLSNIFGREPFREVSLTGAACQGVVMGLGGNSYLLALEAVLDLIGSGAERS